MLHPGRAAGHFVDALRNNTAFETGPDDNLKTLALVEAAYARAGDVSI